MRLTLRTLLAWLDDTLSPGEVREIGKQVGESPFAKELVEKIHRVTRQRRLTIPPRNGPEAVDANLVACYLDNELPPDEVTEFEKRCLASDVHLAEVASVHQVLSLIGQKAKVPVEARHRMYGLVKGRESAKPRPRTARARPARRAEPRKTAEPISPWVTPLPPPQPMLKQFGPAAIVVGLILILIWTAMKSMSSPDSAPSDQQQVASRQPGPIDPATLPSTENKDVAPNKETADADATAAESTSHERKAKTEEPSTADTSKPDANPARKKDAETTDASKGDAPKPDVPAGVLGTAKAPSGVLLKYIARPEKRESEWERVTADTPLREQDRLLSLAPFRSTIELGTAKVDLVGETEVWAGANISTQAAKLNVSQGRVVLHGTPTALPFAFQFGDKLVTVNIPAGQVVGVEKLNRREQGEPIPLAPVLRFFASEGTIKLTDGSNEETITGPGAITYESRGKWSNKTSKPAPSWVTEPGLTTFDEQVGEQFLKLLRPGRKIMGELVEASDDDNKDICRYAISSLRAIGDISFIVPFLNKRGTANSAVQRRAAIRVLRAYLAEGPDAFKNLEKQLYEELGGELAPKVEKLLVGYTPKEAQEEATYSRLVQYLGSTDDSEVCVRELALDNLQELTGRDALDYDPEKAEGKGLRAWKDLSHSHELRSAATSKGQK